MEFNEKQFWTLYHESSEKGFKFVYDCFHKMLIGYCVNNGQSQEDAIEITQEVFCKFWTSMGSLSKKQSVQSYLFTISKNVIIDNYRRLVKEKAASEYQFYFLSNPNETENTVLYNELRSKVQNIFDNMPEIRKLVFQMSRFKGYSNKKIAEEVGTSTKTVEGHISKALKTFRDQLGTFPAILIVFLLQP